MKKFKTLYIFLCLSSIIIPAGGQTMKNVKTNLTMEVSDESGNAIPYAQVSSAKDRMTYETDKNGKIQLQISKNDFIKVSAKGYKTVIAAEDQLMEGKVILEKSIDFAGDENKLYTLFGETTERRTVGAYSKVDGKDLESNPPMFFLNAL